MRAASKATLPPPTTTTRSPEVDPEALVDVEEVLDRAQHSVELVAREIEVTPAPGADREEHASCRASRSVERGVAPDAEPELDVDAELEDGVDLAADEPARQAVLGDAEHHHPAEAILAS